MKKFLLAFVAGALVLAVLASSPSFYPEGNTQYSGDNELRVAQKTLGQLKDGISIKSSVTTNLTQVTFTFLGVGATTNGAAFAPAGTYAREMLIIPYSSNTNYIRIGASYATAGIFINEGTAGFTVTAPSGCMFDVHDWVAVSGPGDDNEGLGVMYAH